MAESLYAIYEEIRKNRISWDYYCKHNKDNYDPSNDIFKCEDKAKEFIEKYFWHGSKSVFLLQDGSKLNQLNKRYVHTVSLFFLGIYLYDKLEWDGKGEVSTEEYSKFLFLWFISCLYHDVGYYFENNNDKCIQLKTIEEFISENNIKDDSNLLKSNSDIIYPYSSLLKGYYDYTVKELGHLDHGITGGIILYDRLVQNTKAHGENCCEDGILFSSKLYPDYRKAADAVARHNIWFAKKGEHEERIKKYEKYGIDDELVINGECERLSLSNDNIIYFLLCLADSIEPVKLYSCVYPEEVLKRINVDVRNNEITFSFTDNILKKEIMSKKAEELEDWLEVKCNKSGTEASIEIITLEFNTTAEGLFKLLKS